MGIFDPITAALDGNPQKPVQGPSGPSNTQVTRITPRDLEIARQRRAQIAQEQATAAAARNPGNFAFRPPAPTLRTQDQ